MIIINAGTVSNITLRLNDMTIGATPSFLFEFTSVQSNISTLFTAEDISPTDRYNKFSIYEITGTFEGLNPTASTPRILLDYGGVYNYTVYEVANSDILTPSDVILDEGKMIFKNGEYSNFFFDINDEDSQYIFDEYTALYNFDIDDDNTVAIFDPEFFVRESGYILTEDGEIIMTETTDNLIY